MALSTAKNSSVEVSGAWPCCLNPSLLLLLGRSCNFEQQAAGTTHGGDGVHTRYLRNWRYLWPAPPIRTPGLMARPEGGAFLLRPAGFGPFVPLENARAMGLPVWAELAQIR